MAAAFPSDPDALESDVDAITVYREEQHELLDSPAITMSDAPFNRVNSDEVILGNSRDVITEQDDDDDDDIAYTVTGLCCRSRTPLERALLVLILILVAVVAGLAVGLSRPRRTPRKQYCQSSQCVQAASSIMAAMDKEADPCTDFFQYACGGWARHNPIPRGYRHWDRVQQLAGHNLFVLKSLLDSDASVGSEAEKKAQHFYNSCMADASSPKEETLRRFSQLVKGIGGWSISMTTQASQWQLVTTLQNVHRLGAWPLFKVKVDVDERDPTRRYILKIDMGETVLPVEMYPPLHPPPTSTTSPPTHNSSASATNITTNPINNNSTDAGGLSPSPPPLPAGVTVAGVSQPVSTASTKTTESPAEVIERVKKLFVEETVPLLRALGFNRSIAEERSRWMADLERDIAAAAEGVRQVQDRFSLYNVFTIEELETNFTMFNWRQYFHSQGFEVTGTDEVVLYHPDYLANLTSLLSASYRSSARLSAFHDYMLVILVRSLQKYFDPSIFDMEDADTEWLQESWKRCVFYTNQALGFATGAIFVRGTGQEDHVQHIQNLISYVRGAFKEFILRKFWIDSTTRKRAEQKVDSIINKINYPSYILNASFLDSYYREILVQPGHWFENVLNWRHFQRYRQEIDLRSVPDRQRSWIRPPVTVKAVYSPTRNDVIFPIAMFHLPYYIPGGPAALNFGAMGSVIGHEITHAFDFQGRQYDEEGRLRNWWDHHSTNNFAITTQCMVHQYNNMQVQQQQINGDLTLDENIADNGGLRAAHYAYMKWVKEHGEELPLPSLNLTQHQVFFLSYAQMFCSKWTESGLKYHLLTDPHSPGEARVNGVLANSKIFSWAFQCQVYAKMNAQTKCEVW